MSDKELIARLRDKHCCESPNCNCDEAADRIEALTAEVRRWHGLFDEKHRLMLEEKAKADALTEQLEAARADAKEAEAYAEELEKEIELNEQEACMVEDDLIKADKEIDDLKAKLAKAVEALRQIAEQTKGVTPEPDNLQIAIGSIHSYARATLAEIEGEKG
jgi:chromosome segregation ATPase